ncbi:MAG TPA: hypothetical protein PKI68_01035 [Pontiellaceae bacterium]|nr:hypothetical protein [Pontiellaceae bacterium]
MSKQVGSSGVITGAGIAGVNRFSITMAAESPEKTVMGAAVKAFMAGITSFNFEAEGIGETPSLAETFTVSEGNLKSFDIEGVADTQDVTAIGDVGADDLPFRSFIAGLAEWTANLNCDFEGAVPQRGAEYTFAGAAGIITSVSVNGEVNGLINATLQIKGKGALPTGVNTAGTTINFSVACASGAIASGAAIVTSSKISGSVGGLITYSVNSQGTGELTIGEAA